MMTREERENSLIVVRASLGRWRHPDNSRWTLLQEIAPADRNDSRTYKVSRFLQSYKPVQNFNTTFADMSNFQIPQLRREGYKLIEPKFPQLQEQFRDGEPITGATVISDFMDDIKPTKRPQTGLEAMLEAFS